MTVRWPAELERHIRLICGPEDEVTPEVNGDPDSTVGEDDCDEEEPDEEESIEEVYEED